MPSTVIRCCQRDCVHNVTGTCMMGEIHIEYGGSTIICEDKEKK